MSAQPPPQKITTQAAQTPATPEGIEIRSRNLKSSSILLFPVSTKDALADLEGVARAVQQASQTSLKDTSAPSRQNSVRYFQSLNVCRLQVIKKFGLSPMGDAAIPSGFFDDPEKEMKARGLSHDFSNEFESFNELLQVVG